MQNVDSVHFSQIGIISACKLPLLDQQGRGELLQSAKYQVYSVTVPLPRLPVDSDSTVVAEIAGRSVPDEHSPVWCHLHSPLLQYTIPYAGCMNMICP